MPNLENNSGEKYIGSGLEVNKFKLNKGFRAKSRNKGNRAVRES